MAGNDLAGKLFRFFSDIFAILVLPYILVLLSCRWLAIVMSYFPWSKNYDLLPVFAYTAFTVGGGLFYFGLCGNFQRSTPILFARYVLRASGLTMGLEAAAVIVSYLVIRFYPSGRAPHAQITQGGIVFCVWILAFLAYLWFGYFLLVFPDLQNTTKERILRGEIVQGENDIVSKANLDK